MKSLNRARIKRNRRGLTIRQVEGLEGRQLLASITEFAIPSGTPRPTYITSGPDGNLWFAEQNADKIGRITPAGTVTEFDLPSGSQPEYITSGSDGNLWFTDPGNNTIGRITLTGTVTQFNVPTTVSSPSGITAGPDGALWFTEATGNKIGRITTSGSFTEYTGGGLVSAPGEIVTGSDGDLWFTDGSDEIGKIIPSGEFQGIVSTYGTSAASYPRGITVGSDGNIWFTESGTNYAGRITTTGAVTEFSLPNGSDYPSEITSGQNGDLYISEDNSNTIVEISTNGVLINQYVIPTSSSSPDGITVGPDGNIWFVEYIGDQVGELDVTAATTLSVATASGVYGGTTSLSATLTSASLPVANEPVTFYIGETEVGTATTNAQGVASLPAAAVGSFDVGIYAGDVRASFVGDPSYVASDGSADLGIAAAPLRITIADLSRDYGDANPTLLGTVSGVLNGDDVVASFTTSATTSSHVQAGGYPITLAGLSGSKAFDYSTTVAGGSVTNGTLTVTPAMLTIDADDKTKVYGAALPMLTATYTGFVNDDSSSNLSTRPTLSTNATSASPVVGSPYSITASGAVDSDYTISYAAGNLSVTPATLLLTVQDADKVYGQVVPTLIGFYSGFVNGDTPSVLTSPAVLSTTATTASHVGSYPIVASGAASSNYTVDYAPGTLTVSPATLTVTADDVVKPYGVAVPTLTASYSGFVNGDTSASLATPVSLSTTATLSSDFGTYPIVASGGASTDYTIVYASGTLTIPTNAAQVAFLDSVYQGILGRAPEPFGLDAWQSALNNGMSPSATIALIYNSPEAIQDRANQGIPADATVPARIALIEALYADVLGRAPETAGLAGWMARMAVGMDAEELAAGIYQSSEAVDDRSALTPLPAPTIAVETDLVTALYLDVLDREPEAPGLAGWLAKLDEGMDAEELAADIYQSPEAVDARRGA